MVSLAPATVATRARDEYDNLVASLPSHAGQGNACDMEVDDADENIKEARAQLKDAHRRLKSAKNMPEEFHQYLDHIGGHKVHVQDLELQMLTFWEAILTDTWHTGGSASHSAHRHTRAHPGAPGRTQEARPHTVHTKAHSRLGLTQCT